MPFSAGSAHGLVRWFRTLSLSARFALTGSVVMLAAALLIGAGVSRLIESYVVGNTASATALFMDGFIAPLAQELETADALSPGPVRAIEEALSPDSALGSRVVSVKIWKRGGLIAYAEDPSLIGKRFPGGEELAQALDGRLVYELDALDDEESEAERLSGLSLLEIYSPIRKSWTGEVIGAVEFYEDATELHAALWRARLQTAAIVFFAALMIGLALFGIVRGASATIERQGAALVARIADAERIGEQNRRLRLRVERASARGTELNERLLRRISADLHDGPAQLMSLAALRLDGVAAASSLSARQAEASAVREALTASITEIRNLSHGLSLPEIEGLAPGDIVRKAVAAHERRTGTTVALRIEGSAPPSIGNALAICIFRFVQEGLNNAFRHADGDAQRVEAVFGPAELSLAVLNAVPAEPRQVAGGRGGLGLSGLRDRVESLGGRFGFSAEPGGVAQASMVIGWGGGNADGG